MSVIFIQGKTTFKFTKMIHKYPNEAYDWFIANSHCWKIFEGTLPDNYKNKIPSKKMKPLRLIVPKSGNQMVYVYGRFPECSESEKKFLQSLKSKNEPTSLIPDNFVLIAQNITFIYLILKSKFASMFPNRQSLLATVGIINVMRYIEANEIEPAEIIAMARSSVKQKSKFNLEDEIYELCFFIRTIEVELFAIDTNLEYFEIRNAVSTKFSTIRKTVTKLFADYDRDKKLSPTWEIPTTNFMVKENFVRLRALVGIISC